MDYDDDDDDDDDYLVPALIFLQKAMLGCIYMVFIRRTHQNTRHRL